MDNQLSVIVHRWFQFNLSTIRILLTCQYALFEYTLEFEVISTWSQWQTTYE